MRALHPRLSRNEPFVFQHRRFDEFHQRIAEQIRIGTVIKTPSHLVQVGLQMLRADFVPRTHDAPLEQREGALNRVRMDVSLNVDAPL